MLKLNSVQLAYNLARIAKDRNITVSPVNGTLMSNMTATVVNRWQTAKHNRSAVELIESEDSTVHELVIASDGTRVSSTPQMRPVYLPGEHDSMLDNYTESLSALISRHIVYARSVVYKEMTDFVTRLSENARNTSTPQAEDLFRVNFLTLHPVFESYFIQDEVQVFPKSVAIAETPLTVGGALSEAGIDFSEKFSSDAGNEGDVIKSWLAGVGAARINSFLNMSSGEAGMRLNAYEQADYHLFHFLLNRLMVKDSSMAVVCKTTMTLSQFVTSSATRRDHHAQQLGHALSAVKTLRVLKYVVSPADSTPYSYLSSEPITLNIIEENFQKAVEQGVTLDHIFGYIAKNGMSTAVDIDTLVAGLDKFSSAWNTQRSLYATFLSQTKAARLRSEMKQVLFEIIDSPAHMETMSAVYGKGSEYKDNTIARCNQAIDAFSQTKLEDFQGCAFDLIAVIVHRHSNAKDIISSMFDQMAADANLSSAQAVSVSVVLYLTDYLLSQLQIR